MAEWKRFTAIAAALPALVIGLGIARSEYQLATQTTYRLPVRGYDPRDLLRGHYLLYQVELREPDTCESYDCCVCLSQSTDPPPVMECAEARSRCDATLHRDSLAQLDRYYVPEASAQALERRFIEAASNHRAFIVVGVNRAGAPTVHHLELDGEVVE